VDAELVGDLLHLERLQVLDAVLEVFRLPLDDLVRDAFERAAALLDALDQEARVLVPRLFSSGHR
jgi:hypothetical protein